MTFGRYAACIVVAALLGTAPLTASAQASKAGEAPVASAQAPKVGEAPVASAPAPKAEGAPAPSEKSPDIPPAARKDSAFYRGRPREAQAADALLWIPRAFLLPVFAFAEFGVRRPVYATAEWVEEHKVVPIIEKILNPVPQFSWAPTMTLDLNDNSSFGAKAKWKDFAVVGHELKSSAEAGPAGNFRITASDLWPIGQHVYVGARGDLSYFQNRAFFGLGPRSSSYRTNFGEERYEGFLFEGLQWEPHFRVELSQGYRYDRTTEGQTPSISSRFPTSTLPGFGEVRLAVATGDFMIDSRRVPEQNGGARLLGNLTYAQDVSVAERSFLTASLDLEGAVEVAYPDRVIVLRALAVQSIPLGKEPVPLTQKPLLGGANHVGFITGRLRGDSAVLAELHYRYPIAYYVDAQWTLSAGNVFGERFAGLSVGAMTGTFGVGLRTRRAGFLPLEVTFAFGTSRFEEPFELQAIRVYFGTVEGL